MEVESAPEVVARMVTCAWALWGNRNEIRQGGKQKSGLELVCWSTQYLEEFYATTNDESVARTPSTQPVRWLPPQGQTYKANVERAVFAKLKVMGIGVVVRDKKGKVKAALRKKINAPLGPVEAEAKAFEMGI